MIKPVFAVVSFAKVCYSCSSQVFLILKIFSVDLRIFRIHLRFWDRNFSFSPIYGVLIPINGSAVFKFSNMLSWKNCFDMLSQNYHPSITCAPSCSTAYNLTIATCLPTSTGRSIVPEKLTRWLPASLILTSDLLCIIRDRCLFGTKFFRMKLDPSLVSRIMPYRVVSRPVNPRSA